jgi:porin
MPASNSTKHCTARTPWLFACLSAIAPLAGAQQVEDGPAFSLSAAYTGDLRRNATGGMAVGTAYSDALDLGLAWVTDGLFANARMTTNLSVMHLGGTGISERYVGDLQGVNNLEAVNGWKLYESWVELSFGDSGNTLRAGVLDLNAEFDTPVTQGLFVASPFGIGTELSYTGERGPVVWPTTGLGLRAAGDFNDRLRWRLGAYDGAPGSAQEPFTSTHLSSDEGALLAGELEYSSERIHKAALGLWSYTAVFEHIDAAVSGDSRRQRGNRGFYLHFDIRAGSLGRVDLDTALRAGTAASRFNLVDRYIGAVLTASHLFESRPADSLGFGIARANLGDRYRALRSFEGQPAAAAETTYELVYRAELTPWLSLLPNVQLVRDPGADPLLGDSWIAGLRFELSRERSWPLQARRDGGTDTPYARTQQ